MIRYAFKLCVVCAAVAAVLSAGCDNRRERQRSISGDDYVDDAIERMYQERSDLAMDAVGDLGRLGPRAKPAVPFLIKEVSTGGRLCCPAMRALGRIGPVTGEVLPTLVTALGAKDPGMRQCAAGALGTIGTAAAPTADALVGALSDADALVSREAAHALAKIGTRSKEAVPELVAEVQDEKNGDRQIAALLLGQIGPDASAALPVLQGILGSGAPKTQLQVFTLVGIAKIQGRPDAAVTELVRILETGDLSGEAVWSAADVLGKLGRNADPAIDVLAATFRKPGAGWHLRLTIAETFQALGTRDPGAIEVLKAGRTDPQEYVRNACERALERLTGKGDTGAATTRPSSAP